MLRLVAKLGEVTCQAGSHVVLDVGRYVLRVDGREERVTMVKTHMFKKCQCSWPPSSLPTSSPSSDFSLPGARSV